MNLFLLTSWNYSQWDAEIIISKIMKLFDDESICRKIVKLLIVICYDSFFNHFLPRKAIKPLRCKELHSKA